MQTWLVIGMLLALAAAAVVSSIYEARKESIGETLPRSALGSRVPAREFSLVALSDAFEPELACIWEPQIEVLKLIGEAGPDGLDHELLRPAHGQLVNRYPELYEGSDLESWLEAMERADLISWNDSTVKLTSAGTAFLKCRRPVTA